MHVRGRRVKSGWMRVRILRPSNKTGSSICDNQAKNNGEAKEQLNVVSAAFLLIVQWKRFNNNS